MSICTIITQLPSHIIAITCILHLVRHGERISLERNVLKSEIGEDRAMVTREDAVVGQRRANPVAICRPVIHYQPLGSIAMTVEENTPLSVTSTKHEVDASETGRVSRGAESRVGSEVSADRKPRRSPFEILQNELLQRAVRYGILLGKRLVDRHRRQNTRADIVRARV